MLRQPLYPLQTPAITEEPTPEITEKPDFIVHLTPEQIAEINQGFQDFLNGVGSYSDEELQKSLYNLGKYERDLGLFMAVNGWYSDIQGIPLYFEEYEGGVVIAFGVKNRDGNRCVTIAEWPTKQFGPFDLNPRIISRSDLNGSSMGEHYLELISQEEVNAFLVERMNKPVLFTFLYGRQKEKQECYDINPDDVKKITENLLESKIEQNYNLILNVKYSDLQEFWGPDERALSETEPENDMLIINTYENFIKLKSNIGQIPLT